MRKKLWKVLLFLFVFLCCYPVVFTCVGSFMGNGELSDLLAPMFGKKEGFVKWNLLPMEPTLRSWIELLLDTPEFFVTFWNSVKITAGILLGQLLFAVPAAWGFAKHQFPFCKSLFVLYVILMMMPFQVLMLSNYLVLDKLHLLDTLWALILPGIFSTFPVFIMYNSFRDIPNEVIEAGRIDGATEFGIFFKIGIPLGKSGIFSAMVLSFLECWNLIEQPLTFLKDKTLFPMSVFLPAIEVNHAGTAFAVSVIALIPAMIIFLLGQDYLEKGISYMSRKE